MNKFIQMVSHHTLGSSVSSMAKNRVELDYFHGNFISCDRKVSIASRIAGGFNV